MTSIDVEAFPFSREVLGDEARSSAHPIPTGGVRYLAGILLRDNDSLRNALDDRNPPSYLCIGSPIFFVTVVVVAFLKAIITVIPTVLVVTLASLGIVLYTFPHISFLAFRAIVRCKQLQGSEKYVASFLVFVTLLTWPAAVVTVSILGSLAYGYLAPQIYTFEALSKLDNEEYFSSLLAAGPIETWKSAWNFISDFKDLCFLSIPQYLEEQENLPELEDHPTSAKLLLIPGCILVSAAGVIIDTLLISSVIAYKSLFMMYRGWQQLVWSSLLRKGPCTETVCLPVAFFGIIVWPAAVAIVVLLSILCSPFVGLYAGVVAYHEGSLTSGFLYSLAMAAMFDEQINELLEVEGPSCIPKPVYRRRERDARVTREFSGGTRSGATSVSGGSQRRGVLSSLVDGHNIAESLRETSIGQVWSSLFEETELLGQELSDSGVLKETDLADWLAGRRTDGSRLVGNGLPSLRLARMLLRSYHCGSEGLVLGKEGPEVLPGELSGFPFYDLCFEPLIEFKCQLEAARLLPGEERYLESKVLWMNDEDRSQDWMNGYDLPTDRMRLNTLEAFARRLQGISATIVKLPGFRRLQKRVIQKLQQGIAPTVV